MASKEAELKAIFYGRGGQGAKSTADIFAKAAIYQGYYAQSFSKFGAEKSGTPVFASIRISAKEIRTHEPVENCDVLVIVDETLLMFNPGIVSWLNPDSKLKLIITNSVSDLTIENLKKAMAANNINAKIIKFDATGIALKHIGNNHPNTSLLAKLYKELNDHGYDFSIDMLKKVVHEIFEEKGDRVIQQNLNVIDDSYK